MKEIKKGDIVARKSYNKDVFFEVNYIYKDFAILTGTTIRIIADAPIDDLVSISKEDVRDEENRIDEKLRNRINKYSYRKSLLEFSSSSNSKMGKILHLDGDRKYGIKSERYYRKMGLNAIVKYIPEHNQPSVINQFIYKYNPDIIVITGHDRHDKKESRL